MRARLLLVVSSCLVACASAPAAPVRVAWDQAEAVAIAARHRYTVAVDGRPHVPLAVVCATDPTAATVCTATLPRLAVGTHALVLAVVDPSGARQVLAVTVTVAPDGQARVNPPRE